MSNEIKVGDQVFVWPLRKWGKVKALPVRVPATNMDSTYTVGFPDRIDFFAQAHQLSLDPFADIPPKPKPEERWVEEEIPVFHTIMGGSRIVILEDELPEGYRNARVVFERPAKEGE